MNSVWHFIVAFLFPVLSFAQPDIVHEFGKPSQSEFDLKVYEKDSTAAAVYIYERGDYYYEAIENRIWIIKEYYGKIKVFNSLKFNGVVEIPLRLNNFLDERVQLLEAITHNNNTSDTLDSENVFTKHESGIWNLKTFAFPNVKDGSIVEYRYKIASPYHFSLDDWDFQSIYPKMYSEVHAKINANYTYKTTLIGNLKPSIETSRWQKNCFYTEGIAHAAACEIIHVAIEDVPAFFEEDFMLSKKNYAARVSFDLIEYIDLFGKKKIYSKPWKDIDESFERENVLFKQLSYKNYFKNKIPSEIRKITDPVEQAKQVFSFMQNHYTWNEYVFRIDRDFDLIKTYSNKTASVDEINLALLNSLLGLGHKAHIMLIATRNRGFPNDTHTSFHDYNYLVVRLEIDNKVYLLDASDKFIPFGFLPYRALNHFGRVLNYNGVSFWQDTKVLELSHYQINIFAKLDSNNTLFGKVNERFTNYMARNQRAILETIDTSDYKTEKEKKFKNIKISDATIFHQNNNDVPLVERFEFEIGSNTIDDKLYINPFIHSFFTYNPLTLSERNYPINFGFPRTYSYQISLEIPEHYEVLELPENQSYFLYDNSIEINFTVEKKAENINLSFVMKIGGIEYPIDSYTKIKELFAKSIDIQNNSFIILKKK